MSRTEAAVARTVQSPLPGCHSRVGNLWGTQSPRPETATGPSVPPPATPLGQGKQYKPRKVQRAKRSPHRPEKVCKPRTGGTHVLRLLSPPAAFPPIPSVTGCPQHVLKSWIASQPGRWPVTAGRSRVLSRPPRLRQHPTPGRGPAGSSMQEGSRSWLTSQVLPGDTQQEAPSGLLSRPFPEPQRGLFLPSYNTLVPTGQRCR